MSFYPCSFSFITQFGLKLFYVFSHSPTENYPQDIASTVHILMIIPMAQFRYS